jgi:hypothetical protein
MELLCMGGKPKESKYAERDFSLMSIEQLRKSHKKGASQALAERLKKEKLKTPLFFEEKLDLFNPQSSFRAVCVNCSLFRTRLTPIPYYFPYPRRRLQTRRHID